MKSEDILSVPEAASLLGCSDVWVIKMVRKGDLEGFKLSGRAWAISRVSLEKSIQEYQQRDPSLPGRKREGSRVVLRETKPKSTEKSCVYISGQEAAKRLGVAPITVSRIARREGIGIIVEGGRLAALAITDLQLIRPHIHETSGNPDWIAGRGIGKESRAKPPTRRKSH